MDISKIKAKLSQLQSKGSKSSYEKIDYSKIFWKPKEGKQVIRIVPSKINKDFPFREVFFHYDIVKRSMLALTNWGEKDPIVEFSKQLYKSEDKDDQSLARKLSPRVRVFAILRNGVKARPFFFKQRARVKKEFIDRLNALS